MDNHILSEPRGHRRWSIPTLIHHALRTKDEKRSWKSVVRLQLRGTREVFIAAASLCRSTNPHERRLGADILGQLGTPKRPFRIKSVRILHQMLRAESETKVLNSILTALGHCQKKNDRYGLRSICRFHVRRSTAVRFGVVMALLGRTDKLSVDTLVALSADKSPGIRDWATFGLGTMIKLNSPQIRHALARRLADRDDVTRSEAIAGLAKRNDDRGITALVRELNRPRPMALIFEVANDLADRTPLPPTRELISS
jgi:HEAT repeat protein